MKKLAAGTLAILLIGVWAAACTTVVVKDTGPEVLLPGQFIESVDANTVLVKCQGKGGDMRSAVTHARKGCLEWFITNQLAQTPSERQAYMANQKSIFAKLDRYVGIPPPGSASGKGKGIKSRVRMDENTLKVDIITDVHKQLLQDDLVAMNIITSKEDMLDAVGRPTLMTVPFKASKGNKYRGIIEGQLKDYLTENRWEVLSPEAVANLDKMVDAMGEVAGAEEDEVAKLAMAAGADVYIQFEAKKEKSKGGGGVAYTVRVEASETTTGQALAAKSVTSPARSDWNAGAEARALQEAMADAMGQVIPKIMGYWKEWAPKGRKFYLVFNNAPKKADMRLSSALKRGACSQVKVVRSTKSTVHMRVQCKMDNMELAGAIDDAISGKLGGADYEFVAKNRNNIIVQFN